MKQTVTLLASALALLALAPIAQAQTTTPNAAYTGPRYPGGPDSLRAFVGRSTRLTSPAPTGRMLVQFELQPDGKAQRYTMVRPPDPLNPALVKATATALDYIEAHMPAWELSAPDPQNPVNPKVTLLIDFTLPPGAQPYYYVDQHPVFANIAEAIRAKNPAFYANALADPAKRERFNTSAQGLTVFVQMQTKYPPEALRNRQQGQVYAYFEVAENGSIEHQQILGSAGRALDREVLDVLQKIPSASSPALLRGRPVRLYYVLPLNFKIQ